MAEGDIKGVKEVSSTYTEVLLNGIFPQSAEILIIKQITAAAYAALNPKISTTLYIIVG